MTKNNRVDFTDSTKRILAERVAWKCSYPGCGQPTVGPASHDLTKSIKTGEAAHIHAASPQGPRYNKEMSRDEIRDIRNGIWMCRHHSGLIDTDYTEYSPDTLRAWKQEAERRAAEALKLPAMENFPDGSTLVQLGSQNIFHATWEKVGPRNWSFSLIQPEVGSLNLLMDYISSLGQLTEEDGYIVVESQGDARLLNDASLEARSGRQVLEVSIQDRIPPTDPHLFGATFKIGDDYDFCGEVVRGVESAKQKIMMTMGVAKGEIERFKDVGSMASAYFAKYSGNLGLLSRLIKMELIRLSLVPVVGKFNQQVPQPSLHFIKRVVNVTISSAELSHSRLAVSVELEWGNGDCWSGNIPVFIHEQSG